MEDIAEKLGISRSRVAAIEYQALAKMRKLIAGGDFPMLKDMLGPRLDALMAEDAKREAKVKESHAKWSKLRKGRSKERRKAA